MQVRRTLWSVTLVKRIDDPDPHRRVGVWFHTDRDTALSRAEALSRLHGGAMITETEGAFSVDARSYFSDGGPWP